MSVDHFFDGLMVIGPQHAGGGKSAYAYAVDGGYIGTEEEFGIRLAALLNGGITATVDTDTNRITLSGTLVPGTYTAYYEVQNDDGTKSPVEIGELTLAEEEPEPAIYTVTFMADGVIVAVVTYEEGATAITEPTVPAKDGYTGAWESYSLNNTNITVNAVYTAIEVEPEEPMNFAQPLTAGRLSNSATGYVTSADAPDSRTTAFIPVQNGDTLYVKGFARTNIGVRFMTFDSSKTRIGSLTETFNFSSDYAALVNDNNTTAEFNITSGSVAYVRFSQDPSGLEDEITVNIKRNGEWLTE